jgi:hypothetical protein
METTTGGTMKKFTDRIKREFEENPVQTLMVAALVATAAAKLIDALSAAQGRRAYSKQVNYRVSNRR